MQKVTLAGIAGGVLLSAAAAVLADTTAYWRHEEGTAGTVVSAGANTVLDSSGNVNHMRTFDPTFTAATYSTLVSPLPLRSGLPNTLALDFGQGGDDAGLNDDNYTEAKPINSKLFTAMTAELAFNVDGVGTYRTLLGKDGRPLNGGPGEADLPWQPFKIQVTGVEAVPNELIVQFIDGDGDVHVLGAGEPTTAGEWYHVAFTLTGTTAELWVARETTPYTLVDTLSGDFAGASGEVLIADPGDFTVGRGMFNGAISDWVDGKIDEVRITDTALSSNQFLFTVVPEPSCAALLALGLFYRSRRQIG